MSDTIKILDLNRETLDILKIDHATFACGQDAYVKWVSENNRDTASTSWDFTNTAVIVNR
jgi:hypothetical protein